jgi:Zn-dependent M28 family amino/carboxypeptidase
VPIVETIYGADASLKLGGRTLRYPDDAVVGTRRVVAESRVTASPIVFAGYGIVAPEYGWNDYEGLDVRGKTVVVLINDPGFATGDPALFRGRAMTYYGRWTYKFEEAARQGAAALLIVHETEPAAYAWDVVRNGWTGPQLGLETPDGNASRAAIEGWITREAVQQLFRDAGLDFAAEKLAASRRGYRARQLGQTAEAYVRTGIRHTASSNVVAVLRGSKRPDEYVLYCAHWDHLGRNFAGGDNIFNGAVDNATGTAGLLAIASAYARAGRRPERSIVFLAVTAEESGLIGSEYYASNPVFPLARTVAVINMDGLYFGGPTRDVSVLGWRSSELQPYLERAARAHGMVLSPEPTPEKGFFFRSDHFNFAKAGVPALYVKVGVDDLPGGTAAGLARNEDYDRVRYHKVGDEYRPGVDDIRGAHRIIELLYQVGAQLARESRFPNWHPGSEFRAARDLSRQQDAVGRR